jgi:hypothetical protein
MNDENEVPLSEQLRQLFYERFGNDWRREVTLTLRADKLYWLVHLAERGVEAKRADFKAAQADPDRGPFGSAEAAASLASWRMDLEKLVSAIQLALSRPPRKGK